MRSFPKRERVNLAELYPGTDARGIELLYKMLEFDPNQRITAEQALQNSYFDEIRLPHQENIAPAEIDMTIDDLENESITIKELKKIVVEVI